MSSTASGPPAPLDLLARERRRREIVRDLERAVGHEQLEMLFQPIVELREGRIVAVRVVLRREGAGVSPRDVGRLGDEGESVEPVGRWILTTACSEVAAVRRLLARREPLGVTVSVPEPYLTRGDLAADVDEAFRLSGLGPADLTLEADRPALVAAARSSSHILRDLHHRGVGLTLDGCRETYGSLLFIQHLGADGVKLDLEPGAGGRLGGAEERTARAVIRQAHSLHATVTVGGVEDPEQVTALREMGCDLLLGPYFAPPLSPADLLVLCRREERLWSQPATADGT